MALATDPWELTAGLGNIPAMAPGTGMLFDTGYEHNITVTTEPMLFPIDIAFLDEDFIVTEVYLNIQPGYLITSTAPARYFIEVNAGEMAEVQPGDRAYFQLFIFEGSPSQTEGIASKGTALLAIAMVAGFAGVFIKDLLGDLQPALAAANGGDKCELLYPSDYELLSWFDRPLPDYSFAIEPETKERRIDEMLKKLKEGVEDIQGSQHFREFLLTMSKFHDYSIGNLILITLQRKDATQVAGFTTWKELGRWVKKNERGIAILAPCFPPKGTRTTSADIQKSKETAEEEQKIEEIRPVYFKVVYVFDVSQTEGKELPRVEVPSLTGDANENLFAHVLDLSRDQGLDVGFEPRPQQDPAIKGMYFGKSIWVKPEESRAQQLKTLFHEVAHYYSEGVFRISRRDAETIAESVAFTVGARFGFDTGTRSFPYVALWSQDKKVLEQNLASIRKISTLMIEALESKQANQLSMVK
jgi:uncharacterized membrane protein (UPF0127 family)